MPSRTISRGPRGQSIATGGTPTLIASVSTIGNPSACEVSAKTEACASTALRDRV